FEINELKTIRNDKADCARQLLGNLLQPHADEMPQLQTPRHRRAHGHGARTDAVFLVARQIDELAHPRQRMGQSRHRRARQPAAAGNFQIAQSRLVTLEATQDVERSRYYLNNVAFAAAFARNSSHSAQTFRAPPHAFPRISLCGMKFHLPTKLPQATWGDN